jgi:hypothetical protein
MEPCHCKKADGCHFKKYIGSKDCICKECLVLSICNRFCSSRANQFFKDKTLRILDE